VQFAAAALALRAVTAIASGQADAAEQSPESAARESAPAGQVTIEGQRKVTEERARSYISRLTTRNGIESLQRWRRPICPLVAGLRREHGEIVLGRISQIVQGAGAPLDPEQNCKPNFFVVLTSEPEKVLLAWRKEDRRVFDESRARAIRRFINTPRVVRVMHNVEFDDVNGVPLPHVQLSPADHEVVVNRHARDTRIEHGAVRDLWSAIMVVDTRQLKGMKLGQLADYVSLVGLTRIDQDAELIEVPTILTLFAESPHQAAPDSLTEWDESFLKGLYKTRQGSRVQRGLIEQSMVEAIAR
jgi:hypothetical protein